MSKLKQYKFVTANGPIYAVAPTLKKAQEKLVATYGHVSYTYVVWTPFDG